MWNKHAMGWFAVWKMPMSTFALPSLVLSPVLEGEPTILDAVVTLELELFYSFLTVFVLLSPMLMLKSNPSSYILKSQMYVCLTSSAIALSLKN